MLHSIQSIFHIDNPQRKTHPFVFSLAFIMIRLIKSIIREELIRNFKLLHTFIIVLTILSSLLFFPLREFSSSESLHIYADQSKNSIIVHAEADGWLPYEVDYSNEVIQITFPQINPKLVNLSLISTDLHITFDQISQNNGFQLVCSLDQYPFVRMKTLKKLQSYQWHFYKQDPYSLFGKTIVLDPGHGAYDEETMSIYDSGVMKNGFVESALNLQIAFALKPLLEEHGATVILTREKEEDTSTILFKPRIEFINTVHPDIYLSIHHNDSDYDYPQGLFVYYNHPDSEFFAECLFKYVSEVVGLRQNHILTDPLVSLCSLQIPVAALIECAFLSSSADLKLIRRSDYVDRVALGIEKAILSFTGKEN